MYPISQPKISSFKIILISIIFSIFSANLFAEEHAGGEKKFNAGELIGGHITDAHEWHVAGHMALPLPLILYTPGKGFSTAMYNKLEEGEMEGFKLDEKHTIVSTDGS